MKQNEKARKMMNGRFIFPSTWVELNPEKAEASTKVVFLVEDGKCGVYSSVLFSIISVVLKHSVEDQFQMD